MLLALPLAVLITQVTLVRGETDGDIGLAVFPVVMTLTGVLIVVAILVNGRYLQSRRPEPHWMRSHVVRIELRILFIAIIATLLAYFGDWT